MTLSFKAFSPTSSTNFSFRHPNALVIKWVPPDAKKMMCRPTVFAIQTLSAQIVLSVLKDSR